MVFSIFQSFKMCIRTARNGKSFTSINLKARVDANKRQITRDEKKGSSSKVRSLVRVFQTLIIPFHCATTLWHARVCTRSLESSLFFYFFSPVERGFFCSAKSSFFQDEWRSLHYRGKDHATLYRRREFSWIVLAGVSWKKFIFSTWGFCNFFSILMYLNELWRGLDYCSHDSLCWILVFYCKN